MFTPRTPAPENRWKLSPPPTENKPHGRPRTASLKTAQVLRLKAERVQLLLGQLEGWRLASGGGTIFRRFTFPGLRAAIAFTTLVAEIAGAFLHQLVLDVHGGEVKVTIGGQDAGGLTLKDFELASAVSLQP